MPKYGNFEKWLPVSKTDVRRAKISFISTPCGRKRVHIQLWDLSSNSRFHAQIRKFKKSASISETAARRHMVWHKWAQFEPHEAERVCVTSRTTSVHPSLFLCQNLHADLEFACNFCFLVLFLFLVNNYWLKTNDRSYFVYCLLLEDGLNPPTCVTIPGQFM